MTTLVGRVLLVRQRRKRPRGPREKRAIVMMGAWACFIALNTNSLIVGVELGSVWLSLAALALLVGSIWFFNFWHRIYKEERDRNDRDD